MLPLVRAERALGATAGGFPKRLITVAWANGVAQPNFYSQSDDPTDSAIMTRLAFPELGAPPAALDNIVRDLLGDMSRPGKAFPPENFVDCFNNRA
jgi:hypothetical protein